MHALSALYPRSDSKNKWRSSFSRPRFPRSSTASRWSGFHGLTAEDEELLSKQRRAPENQAASLDRQLGNLKKLRIRDILDDAEFLEERQNLTLERIRAAQELEKLAETGGRFEPDRLLIQFNKVAASRFENGSPQEKRFILQILGSNPRLRDRELKIDAAKPFRRWSKSIGHWRPAGLSPRSSEVRTFLAEPGSTEKLGNTRQLMERSQAGREMKEEGKVA